MARLKVYYKCAILLKITLFLNIIFFQVIKELRNFGASYDLKDCNGMTAVHYAVDGGHLGFYYIIFLLIIFMSPIL